MCLTGGCATLDPMLSELPASFEGVRPTMGSPIRPTYQPYSGCAMILSTNVCQRTIWRTGALISPAPSWPLAMAKHGVPFGVDAPQVRLRIW